MKKYLAELVGTFVLTFLGCGAAVSLNCGADTASVIGTAVAFGLTVVAMAYAIGAITLGVLLSGRMSGKDACGYIVGQVIGAILAAAALYLFVTTSPGLAEGTTTGANACAAGQLNGFIVECFLTFIFVLVVLGATSKTNGATNNFAGLAIGLAGTSVNPARSIGPALFEGGQALTDLWVFIVAPLVGAAVAAGVWTLISGECCCKCKKED